MIFRALVLSIFTLSLTACNMSGSGQKGPFKAGSNVTVSRLNNQALPIASGAVGTQVSDNQGRYSAQPVQWNGWTEVSVSGQYFDEFSGADSNASLTLDAITTKNKRFDTANVHLFSHLAAARIRQRVASGLSRTRAWKKTQIEMKRLFGLPKVSQNINQGVEQLSLLNGRGRYRKDNANLLLFTGSFLATGGNATNLATLANDFADDGKINGVGANIFNAIAVKASTDGLLNTLSQNLRNNGAGNPPNNGDMRKLPKWVIEDTGPSDVTAPVITLLGENPVEIDVGTIYEDAGATAIDDIDEVATATAVDNSDVIDTSVAGTHTVTYISTDAAGNSSTETRTVNVNALADVTPPVITVTGTNPITIVVGTPYVDAGATATDDIDGEVAANAIDGSDVINTSEPATFTVTYRATDIAGNTSTATREVIVTEAPDTTPPELTLLGDNPDSVEAILSEVPFPYEDAGYTATDNRDESVNVTVTGIVQTDLLGTYVLTYTATDVAGNSVTENRTVEVVDTTAPVITLNGENTVEVVAGTSYEDAGATATDNYYGNINVQVSGSVDTETVGTYTLTYTAEDGSNNVATKTRTITITEAPDTTVPVVTLLGDASVTVEAGTNYSDAGATASDNKDGDLTSTIVVGGAVNVNVPATYVLTYNVQDAANNPAVEVTRTVIVVDTIAPTITLVGDASISLVEGSSYTDAGATASDNLNGDISANIVTGGDTVDTTTPGVYTITYNVKDTALNSAAQVTRTVTITEVAAYQIVFITDTTTVPRNLDASLFVQGIQFIASVVDGNGTPVATQPTFDPTGVDLSTPGIYPVEFSYTDPYNRTITNILTVIVENHTPLATSASITVDEDSANNPITLIASDSNQGDTLTFTYEQPTNGSVTGTAPNVTYTPNVNFAGSDSFTFTVSDGIAESTGTISITVTDIAEPNTAPVATAQSVTFEEDSSDNVITLVGTDADVGDTLTYTTTLPTNGVLGGSGQNITYTPTTNFAGSDSFTFTVSDGTESATATVSITVNAIGDAPIANTQGLITVAEDSADNTITLTGTDADGDVLTYEIDSSPANGSLDGSGQNYTYTPNEDYSGADSFTFTVTDGMTLSAPATINIMVTDDQNHAPVADTQAVITVVENSSNNVITITGTDADGDAITYEIDSYPNGSLDGSGQNYTYTPEEDFFGTDSFSFVVNDGDDISTPVTINITVTETPNNVPVANPQALITVAEDSSGNAIVITGTDGDGDPLTYAIDSYPGNGSLDGSGQNYTYTPDEDYFGTDSFTFTVNDGDNTSTATTINIMVTDDGNHAPVANPQAVITVVENSSNNVITITGTDADGDAITYEIDSYPVNGSLDGSGQNYTYTPDDGYVGTDSFSFVVNDGDDTSIPVAINITVTDANIAYACSATVTSESGFSDVYISNATVDRPWSLTSGAITVQDIENEFNAARLKDSAAVQGKKLKMPSQAVWDTYSDSKKALYLINNERCARGIRPYEGIAPEVVTSPAQTYAQFLADNNVFGHEEDGRDPWQRLTQDAGVVVGTNADFFSRGENLAYVSSASTGAFPTIYEAVARSIYGYIYDDRDDTINSNTGIASYGHRIFVLATGLVENSGAENKEGLIGMGRAEVQVVVNFNGTDFNQTKVYSVMNGFDPNENWNMSNVESVELIESDSCLSGLHSYPDGNGGFFCAPGIIQ